jgi:hypothetical protein
LYAFGGKQIDHEARLGVVNMAAGTMTPLNVADELENE